jgi:DNA-binding MarR family transcriptional regulator
MQSLQIKFLKSKKTYIVARAAIAEKIQYTGCSPEQFVALSLIPAVGITANELAEKSGLLGPSLSRMIRELVVLGVITRDTGAADARKCVLKLTAAGKKLLARVKA